MPLPPLRHLAAAALLLLGCPVQAATAHHPGTQVPGVYHQRIGDLQVTALFDGTVALGRQELVGIDPGAVVRLLDQRYVPEDGKGLQTAVNAYLVQRGTHLMLVDAGTAQCFGPGLGQVLGNLRAAGYDPAEVDDVLLTHAHPDHLCGVLDADGRPAFAKATVWLSQADADYWLDPDNEARAPRALRFAFPLARAAVAPYQAAGRLRRFAPGTPLPAGVTAVDTHGHTPGHVSWRIDGGSGQLLVWGDIVHFHAVQFARPEASYEADSDRPAAIASRRRIMAEAAARGSWVAGAHLPFPGLGHVRSEGDGFAWVPGEFSPLVP
ncbi:MBL fold metallo-hydrolase [Stenotrophomonas mori]|uniref:MBL fold metallo-hydrolase n=1 Tax=Stenotrophomonas mori TaxID=2871096 RepID=A0ABT0SIY9_9GAMM|nr:MBL fold metallo-hydrolase [Stenotrophomonas mori]MCL7715063.1 MBL fold metallo-hydrolase [Stenotrophomonas mori]